MDGNGRLDGVDVGRVGTVEDVSIFFCDGAGRHGHVTVMVTTRSWSRHGHSLVTVMVTSQSRHGNGTIDQLYMTG